VVRTVPESQIVETLIDEAMRIADEMTGNGTDAGTPEVSVF
jgi:(E)-4-hydroxy-3-methylbut-2-enyl-diphosphate synthase